MLKELRALKGQVLKETKVLKELKELKEPRALKGQVLKETKVLKELKELKELKVLKELKDQQGSRHHR